jgi:AcrR family transcriptional regulator
MQAVVNEPVLRRHYTSPLRSQQAEQTRERVLAAAVRLFAETGWVKTTLPAVAEQAGVAVETIYKGWGSKKALLAAAMDVAIVGDAATVPLLEREPYRRLLDAPPAQRLAGGVALMAEVASGPVTRVWAAMKEAAAADADVAGTCSEYEQRRRQSLGEWLSAVYGHPVEEATLDSLWVQSSHEVFTKLTAERGWTVQQWRDWFTARVIDALGEPDG